MSYEPDEQTMEFSDGRTMECEKNREIIHRVFLQRRDRNGLWTKEPMLRGNERAMYPAGGGRPVIVEVPS